MVPGRLGEIRRSCLDPRAAANRLGWAARTPLPEGLERTLASLRR
jgi:UDP-glucose 4-epimerase